MLDKSPEKPCSCEGQALLRAAGMCSCVSHGMKLVGKIIHPQHGDCTGDRSCRQVWWSQKHPRLRWCSGFPEAVSGFLEGVRTKSSRSECYKSTTLPPPSWEPWSIKPEVKFGKRNNHCKAPMALVAQQMGQGQHLPAQGSEGQWHHNSYKALITAEILT